MEDSNVNSQTVQPQPAKFAVGDAVKFDVDGELYNATVTAVSPVGGGETKYSVAREHDGVTGFKSKKYVPESSLTAVESEDGSVEATTKVRKNKKASPVEEETPVVTDEPVTEPTPAPEVTVPEEPTPVVDTPTDGTDAPADPAV
jgi:hypothetical protein